MSILLWLLILVAAPGVILSVLAARFVWNILKERRSRTGLSRFGREYDLKAEPGGIWQPPPDCLHMDLFRDGVYREALNVMRGHVSGRPVMVFDYRFTTDPTERRHTRRYQVALIEVPIHAPRLAMRPERFRDVLARWANLEDTEFESEEFNRRFRVQCEDRRFAFDVFHPRMLQCCLDHERMPAIEMEGPFLVLYDGPFPPEQTGDPDVARRLLDIGRDIVQSLPSYVRHDRASAAPPHW
jgi:hypothetical protein